MREGVRNAIIGVFAIGGTIAVAVLLMLFGEFDGLFEPRYAFHVRLNNAGGLYPSSPVRLNGVQVGVVDSVELVGGGEYPIEVIAMIESDVLVPKPVAPTVEMSLIGGAAVLLLEADADAYASGETYPTDGSVSVNGEYLSMPARISRELDLRLTPFAEAAGSFATLGDSIGALSTSLESLIGAPGETEDPESIRATVRRINAILDDSHEAVIAARAWLEDDELKQNVTGAVDDARASMTVIQATAWRFDEALKSVQQTAGEIDAAVAAYRDLGLQLQGDARLLVDRTLPALDNVSEAFHEIEMVAETARTGEGSAAALLNNPDLYNNLNDAAARLDRALVEARLLIEKIKAEGVRINF